MQDNAQRADRPAVTSGMPEDIRSDPQAAEVYGLLQSLLDMTRTAVGQAAENDPAMLREFLARRAGIMEMLVRLAGESAPGSALRQRRFKRTLAVLMQTILTENARVIDTIRERKKAVLAKIADAQKRRQVIRYTQ